MCVQRAESTVGRSDPIVGRPPGDDRVELGDHRVGVGPAQGPHRGGQPSADPPQRVVLGSVSSAPRKRRMVKPTKSTPSSRFVIWVLVSLRPAPWAPFRKPRLDPARPAHGQMNLGPAPIRRRLRHRHPRWRSVSASVSVEGTPATTPCGCSASCQPDRLALAGVYQPLAPVPGVRATAASSVTAPVTMIHQHVQCGLCPGRRFRHLTAHQPAGRTRTRTASLVRM
jgi:hypothetical protein